MFSIFLTPTSEAASLDIIYITKNISKISAGLMVVAPFELAVLAPLAATIKKNRVN